MAVLYIFSLFLSALLLFWVEPMVGKMLLPTVGGAPAMWNTLMLFFQVVLLAGYAYAHLSTSRLGVRRSAEIHLLVLLSPFVVLPIAFAHAGAPNPGASPVLWLLETLFLYVGLPFFAVSASAPLLQRWFSHTAHPWGRDPYFLYAASNFGSLLALLGYPLLLEPFFPVAKQSGIWMVLYGLLIFAIVLCAVALRSPAKEPAQDKESATSPSRARSERLLWVFYAFVPSSLMLGVTTYITTDLAAVPLLWVIPLAIYLLTFILTFARKPLLSQKLTGRILPYVFIPMAPLVFMDLEWKWMVIPYHLLVFFFAALLCHGALAVGRPRAARLTEFYLCMSIGGALGGFFNAIVAPVVFSRVVEYPLAMALACLALPCAGGKKEGRGFSWLDIAKPAFLALGAAALVGFIYSCGARLDPLVQRSGLSEERFAFGIVFTPLAVAWFSFKGRPAPFALGFGVIMIALFLNARIQSKETLLAAERNFFGVKTVTASSGYHSLIQGSTTHGIQNTDPAHRSEPLSYYCRSGPLGAVFSSRGAKSFERVAAVGLGVGTMAAYAGPGQHFTFFEIDSQMLHIAKNERLFTYLADCRGELRIVLGDGRLKLAEAPDRGFDMIILDVFSSDAIPAHFLTREALELYLKKLDDGGLIVFHVSNRYLNLEPLLAALACEKNLAARECYDSDLTDEEFNAGKLRSHYIALARSVEDLGDLASAPAWYEFSATNLAPVWTDQYSNILSLMRLQ